MSTILQSCPKCDSVLELPSGAEGKLAQCPSCDAKFRIGPDAEPPTTTPSAGHVHAGELPVVKKTVEEVLSATTSIFSNRYAPSIGSCLVTAVISFFIFGLPALGISELARGGNTLAAGICIALMVPYVLFIAAYMLVGLCRLHLAIARGEKNVFPNLWPPIGVVMRFMPSYLLLAGLIIAVVGLMAVVVVVIALANQPEMANVVGVTLTFVVTGLGTLLQWYLWSWMMVASDGKTSALGSLKVAANITMQNKLSSFFIVIIAVVLSLAGSLLCYVGHIITTPITLVLFAAGYLMMTDQEIFEYALAAPAQMSDMNGSDEDGGEAAESLTETDR